MAAVVYRLDATRRNSTRAARGRRWRRRTVGAHRVM